MDLHACHGTHVAGMIYARELHQGKASTMICVGDKALKFRLHNEVASV